MIPTPIITTHARERCAEMGISTKVAKAILRHGDVTRPGKPGHGARIATWSGVPDYAVVYVEEHPRPIILTVLFRTVDLYERAGATYVPLGAA